MSGCRRGYRHIQSVKAIREHSVCRPVHALRLWRQTVRYCPATSKPDMQLLQPAQSPIVWLLALTVVSQLMTLAASKDPATVQNGYAPTTSPRRAWRFRTNWPGKVELNGRSACSADLCGAKKGRPGGCGSLRVVPGRMSMITFARVYREPRQFWYEKAALPGSEPASRSWTWESPRS